MRMMQRTPGTRKGHRVQKVHRVHNDQNNHTDSHGNCFSKQTGNKNKFIVLVYTREGFRLLL